MIGVQKNAMDKEQEEFQFLELFGIFKESLNIISSYREIFSKIALTIIFPLSIIFLSHIEITQLLSFSKFNHGSAFWIFKFTYLTFFLILTLLSTSAVVYTIASIYTAREVTFKTVLRVAPKVWNRLMVTFLWNFIIVSLYNFVSLAVFVFWKHFIGPGTVGFAILFALIAFFLAGFVYLSVVWHLANVVSVLEDVCGIRAMIKSKGLMKGKMRVSISMFLLLNLCFIGVQVLYQRYVVLGDSLWLKIGLRGVCCNLIAILILVGLVIQTVVYFVCKSYHHESIDKSALANHLEAYLGDYVPLGSQDVQLEP